MLVSIQTSKYFTKSIIIVVIVWFPQARVRPYRSRNNQLRNFFFTSIGNDYYYCSIDFSVDNVLYTENNV